MKKVKYVISIFLLIFLINTAYGFAGMTRNSSTAQIDQNNTTQPDQDIQLLQHLIEVDAVQSENRLFVRETLIFKNTGAKNFSGTLRTWVPDGVEGLKIERRYMMNGTLEYPLQPIQSGNIISWQDKIDTNSLPPLYNIEYMVTAEPRGTLTTAKHYSKTLIFPTLINKQPGSVILKVTRNQGESVAVTDEKGNSISTSGNPREEDNSVLYGWEMPEFKEITVDLSKPAATPTGIAGYVVIGLLILLVFSYPIIRKKSEKLQAIAEKAPGETTPEVSMEPDEEASVLEDAEFLGKTKDELESEKSKILSRLSELDKDYASGNLLDEEYEELRRSYQERAKKITRRILYPSILKK